MRILILNWRDIKNPQSGGAEILTHELAKRLIRNKHEVIQFSSKFTGAKQAEIIDGVKILRDGNPDVRTLLSSVHYKAFRYYSKNLKGKIDLVIDEIHGAPFFTPLYVKEKKVVLICEVAGKLWDVAVKFPFNILGKTVEAIYPLLYKSNRILTISESSKEELKTLGFSTSKIDILPLGCSTPIISSLPKKNEFPTIIFVGRITKQKGIEDAIKVAAILKKTFPKIMLWIVGRGDKEYTKYLINMIARFSLSENVKFWGFTDDNLKNKLLEKSQVLISPSAKEGWGLTVHEAGARGTPSVVYNVEGLREVLVNNVNGYLCSKNTPNEMAKLVQEILENKKKYSALQKGAIEERRKYTWDKTFNKFNSVIK